MPPQASHTPQAPCPCGSSKILQECCLDFIQGRRHAPTAEALMRSRYSAHCLVAVDYLWDTWSAEQRLRSNKNDIRAWAEDCDWLGLQILSTQKGGEQDDTGLVEFVAIYRQQGQLRQHHEISRFSKTLGKWFYVDHADE
uniref:YchJ family protein n=1 Tax=Cellvibrio fontiphilus TaxID=1815559 RepID=UPI002B4BAFB6|nr:YchJ family metal-binding protein [Cellvibrio fontiphilus]